MKSKKRKAGTLIFVIALSKFFILFVIFILLLSFTREAIVVDKLFPDEYEKEVIEIESNLKLAPTQPPFNWSVEKVDDHLTKIALPPDPRMSTNDELFSAMNSYRSAQGVSQIEKTDLLCSIAQNRANEQQSNGDLDGHAGFSKYAEAQDEFSRMGEVLFGGEQPQYGVHIIEYGWDRSLTGHREAIRDPDWRYGCGGVAGYYAVFIFGSR